MRTDISVGLAFANCLHAAGESSPGNLDHGTYAIALGAKDEEELRLIASNLEASGVDFRLIVESSGDYSGQAMAIGVVPGPRNELRKHLSSYPLIRVEDFPVPRSVLEHRNKLWKENKRLREKLEKDNQCFLRRLWKCK